MRPKLTAKITVDEFEDWYWKKSDLENFCREHSVPASGLKLMCPEETGHISDQEKLNQEG